MSKIDLIVPGRHICALRLFAATRDPRYYLNGIHVEIGPQETFFVASNGFTMLANRLIWPLPELAEPIYDITIPINVLKHVGKKQNAVITIDTTEEAGEKGKVHILYDDVTHSAELIRSEKHYPDWRKLFNPHSFSNADAAQFNGHYLALFEKAHAIIAKDSECCGSQPFVKHRGKQSAIVTFAHENFAGLIGPRYTDAAPLPIWAAPIGESGEQVMP